MVITSMNKITLSADQADTRISRHIYGHFAEHLGGCIYGGIWVGPDSPVPNIRGYRKDVVDALKRMRIPNLRWPGGCFADYYHWKDGIGPREQRPSMVNAHWGGTTEDNSFGTHEFLGLCELLECEPYICGNVGSGTVQEISDWVEYVTSPAQCPMTGLRAANGRERPWSARYWGVGNENWGCGGNMRPEYYSDLYRRFSTFMRNQPGNQLYRIAGGPNVDDYHWTEVLMRESSRLFDGLSLHYYTFTGTWEEKGFATSFDESEWIECLQRAIHMETLIRRHSSIMDQYDPSGRVGLIVDEWGTWHTVEQGTNPAFLYQQNTLRDSLVAALTLNIFNRHAKRVHMANIAQTINVLQALAFTNDNQTVLTPTFHVFDMYKDHQDSISVPMKVTSDTYAFGGYEMPAVDVSASLNASGGLLITLCNVDPSAERSVEIDIRGYQPQRVTGQVLTNGEMNAHNSFERPDTVAPTEFHHAKVTENGVGVELPPKSVVALRVS